MKKKLIYLLSSLTVLLLTCTATAASVEQCMQKLPDTISFVHIKDPMRKIQSLINYEKDYPKQGLGYSQVYANNLCVVSVFVYNLNLKNITAKEIEREQSRAEQDMQKSLPPIRETVDQVYVTFINNYFLKLRTTCNLLYTGEEARYNEMVARVVSSTIEEKVIDSMNACLQ